MFSVLTSHLLAGRPPHVKCWLIGKDPDSGRDWGQEEKGTTEDEMAGWHHWLDGRESGWTPGVGDGQGGLACYDSWSRKESDTTEQLNWAELMLVYMHVFHCIRMPAIWETWVRSLGREDPLEKEMATHSSILAWKIPWMEGSGRWQSMGLRRVRQDWATSLFTFMFSIDFFSLSYIKANWF